MCHLSYATLLCWLPQIYTHRFSDHITFLIPVVITHIMTFLPIHTPQSWKAHLWTIQTAVSCLHMVLSRQGPFQYEMVTLQYPSAPHSSPSCFLFFIQARVGSTSGKHLAESKEAAERIRTSWKADKVQFHIRKLPNCWGGECPLATSWSTEMHWLTPLHSLYSHYCLLASSWCSKFWERFLIAFTCSNHTSGHQHRKDLTKLMQDQDTCTKVACRNRMLSSSV